MNLQFPLRNNQTFSESPRKQKSILNLSQVMNTKNSLKENDTHVNSQKSQGVNTYLIELQQKVTNYEEVINNQADKINQLQKQFSENRKYTQILQEKYTILLQSISPTQEKVNVQALLQKIKLLQAQNHQSKNQLKSYKQISLSKQSSISEKLNIKDNQNKSRKNSQNQKDLTILSRPNIHINKDSIGDYVQVEAMRKDQQHFTRQRKNSEDQQYLSVQWKKAIDQYLQSGQSKAVTFKQKTFGMLKKMIPHQLRNVVWPMVFQNKLGITSALYIALEERRKNGWVDQITKSQVSKDILRSFSGKSKQLQNKGKLMDQVSQLLELFHLYRPDISYVQGMTYPAIVLTIIVGKMKAFCIFSNMILSNPFYRRLFTFQSNYLSIYCKTFDILLKQHYPNISQTLKQKKIDSQIFLVQWFYTFFSRGLSFDTTLKIWDHLAYFDQIVIFKICLSVFELIGSYIIPASYEDAISLIKQFGSYIDQRKLIQIFLGSKLNWQKFNKAYLKAIKMHNNN